MAFERNLRRTYKDWQERPRVRFLYPMAMFVVGGLATYTFAWRLQLELAATPLTLVIPGVYTVLDWFATGKKISQARVSMALGWILGVGLYYVL